MLQEIIALLLGLSTKTPFEVALILSLFAGYLIHLTKTWHIGTSQDNAPSNPEVTARETILWGMLLFGIFSASTFTVTPSINLSSSIKIGGLLAACFGLAVFLYKFLNYHISKLREALQIHFAMKRKKSELELWAIYILLLLSIYVASTVVIPGVFSIIHVAVVALLVKVVREVYPEINENQNDDDLLLVFKKAGDIIFVLSILTMAILLLLVLAYSVK